MPGYSGPGWQCRARKYFVGQSRPYPLARYQAARARRGDEPGRSSTRWRRGQDLGRAQSGHALGTADTRLQDAAQQAYQEDDCERSESQVVIVDCQLPIADLIRAVLGT